MPTALELGHEGWKHYVEAASRRLTHKKKLSYEQDEREKILLRIREVALALKTRLGAQRVILFGSLAHDAWFMPDSDVDIAVEGLKGSAYWEAWRIAEEMIGDRPVDLIEIETVSESIKKAIDRHGILL